MPQLLQGGVGRQAKGRGRLAGPGLAGLLLAGLAMAAPAWAQLAPIEAGQVTPAAARALRLEVLVNGRSTALIEPFVMTPPEKLSTRRGVLEEIGIKAPRGGGADDLVLLSALPGVAVRYDDAGQRIDFQVSENQRLPRVYDLGHPARPSAAVSDWGALLNYDLFAETTNRIGTMPRFSGANATLDTRAFSPFGTLDQTVIVGDLAAVTRKDVRLDTTYTMSSSDWSTTGRAGDVISGALPWTRPIRFGGIQVQRDFATRPDIVTRPMPSIAGSAAIPSTVDVFVNNVRTLSQPVEAGPYDLTNLPVVSGNGTARVVVTDATGRQSEASLPFFATATLLAAGLNDFSVDAGFARRDYGIRSNAYDGAPIASAIARHGVTDWLTVEGHSEGGAGLLNGGVGVVVLARDWGIVSAAASLSGYRGKPGAQIYGAYDVKIGCFSLDLSSQRTFLAFDDLASVSGAWTRNATAALTTAAFAFDWREPRALDRVTLGAPVWHDPASVSISLIDEVQADRRTQRIVAASLSRPIPFNGSLFLTAFVAIGDQGSTGFFAGLTMPIGERMQVTAGSPGRSGEMSVSQPLQHEDGSVGWRVRDAEGALPIRSAEVSYRAAEATAAVGTTAVRSTLSSQAQVDGSVGFIEDGGFFAGNRVNDGFAVVDAGAPDIPVLQDNRRIGETDRWGKFVVSDLRSFQANQIAIDPDRLPVDADADATKRTVTPLSHGGLALSFGVDTHPQSALVTFQNAEGKQIAAGSRGHVDGLEEGFVVGYDGQAYIKHLAASNAVTIDVGEADCHASFAYTPQAGRPKIGPITCR